MSKLVRLQEIPFTEFTNLESFRHFRTMLEINKVIMVLTISFIFILALVSATFFLIYNKHNVRSMGKVIVITTLVATVFTISTAQRYLPKNNYELFLYSYEDGDKMFENLDNLSENYLYRGEFFKVNGSILEEIEKDTIEFNVTRK